MPATSSPRCIARAHAKSEREDTDDHALEATLDLLQMSCVWVRDRGPQCARSGTGDVPAMQDDCRTAHSVYAKLVRGLGLGTVAWRYRICSICAYTSAAGLRDPRSRFYRVRTRVAAISLASQAHLTLDESVRLHSGQKIRHFSVRGREQRINFEYA